MPAFVNDIRYCLRVLRKDRGFTLTAILTLALGIGSTTTIFSVVNKVLLEPLNYRDPDRLVLVRERIRQIMADPIGAPAPDVAEFQSEKTIFEDSAAWKSGERDLSSDAGRPARVRVSRVTANLFEMLGARPAVGRTFTASEDRLRQPLAVLSDAAWRTRYASDPGILGRTILLDRLPYTVIGVMPAQFVFPPQGLRSSNPSEIWVPMAFTEAELQQFGDNFDMNVLARLKAGVGLEKAESVLKGTAARIFQKYPAISMKEFVLEVIPLPLREQIVGKVRTLMLLLTGAVLFLLLIACGNVANLMLSRAAAREREFAIRMAVGARRSTVVRQWLTESVLLSLGGGLLGVFLAWYGTDALARLNTLSIPRLSEVHLDLRALGVSLAISILTGLVFGTAPAFFSGRSDLTQDLKQGGRGTAGKERHRVRSILAVAEVALALMLLIGAGLLLRSFLHVRSTDPGIRTENVLTMSLSLPGTAYHGPAEVKAFLDRLDQRLRALPGVMAVGAANSIPLRGSNWTRLFSMENEAVLRGKRPPTAFIVTHGDYFQALGISLKRGRLFTTQDRNEQEPVVIVSEGAARQLWPGEDPIGKRIKFGAPMSKRPWNVVVGVVADVKEASLERESGLQMYVPAAQTPPGEFMALTAPNWIVRSTQQPESLMGAVRSAVAELDPQMPVARLETMEQSMEATLSSRRIQMYVMSLFAGAALLLSALGVYGVIAYSVTQRSQEIAIRMALGATAGGVLRMVLGEGMVLTVAGIAAGVALSAALTRYIETLLFGVKPTDMITFVSVAAILLIVAAAACLSPARRAMGVDSTIALRQE